MAALALQQRDSSSAVFEFFRDIFSCAIPNPQNTRSSEYQTQLSHILAQEGQNLVRTLIYAAIGILSWRGRLTKISEVLRDLFVACPQYTVAFASEAIQQINGINQDLKQKYVQNLIANQTNRKKSKTCSMNFLNQTSQMNKLHVVMYMY